MSNLEDNLWGLSGSCITVIVCRVHVVVILVMVEMVLLINYYII